MKRTKPLPVPQKEFGFTPNTFNLIQDWTNDGERLVRELAETEQARRLADTAQARLFPSED
ncbi:MAG: hypothetical protein EB034_20715 [Verrucomicrobia bacterium]|nr:hypothetical protein [Verrucomicrobiota bacterium]